MPSTPMQAIASSVIQSQAMRLQGLAIDSPYSSQFDCSNPGAGLAHPAFLQTRQEG